MHFIETSLADLYKSTVKAFPKTTKRQHAIDDVKVERLEWVPFLGVKTLFIKGLAKNNDKKYECIMLFKNINYKDKQGKKIIEIKTSTGSEEFLEQINPNNNDVLLRCNCMDFYWRANYANHLDKSLFGRKRKKYESKGLFSANPENSPMMCKHLIKLSKVLAESKIISN